MDPRFPPQKRYAGRGDFRETQPSAEPKWSVPTKPLPSKPTHMRKEDWGMTPIREYDPQPVPTARRPELGGSWTPPFAPREAGQDPIYSDPEARATRPG